MTGPRNASRILFFATLAALVLGCAAGAALGEAAAPLGDVSKLVVQALKVVAVPLLFCAIVESVARSNLSGRGFGWLGLVASFNATAAITIGLLIVNVFEPGRHLAFIRDAIAPGTGTPAMNASSVTWQKVIGSFVPESVVEPFLSGSTTAVIVMALALGVALRRLSREGAPEDRDAAGHVSRMAGAMFRVLITIIGWVVVLVPFAVFGAVAKAVGKSGFSALGGLSVFVIASVGGMALHALLTYQGWVIAHPRLTLRKFWRAAREPTAYAFGINSSLATVPMTLQALEKAEVKEEAARLSACVGTNFNNDGILLYEVMAALILAQAFGIELSVAKQLFVAAVSVAATLGVAGFPEAGVVALTLVLSAVGLPAEAIGLLMSVDWIIARSRSATNVLGDMAVAVAIDRFLPARRAR